MQKLKNDPAALTVISVLPYGLALEIGRLAETRRSGYRGIREIHLRRNGICELNLSGEKIRLVTRLTPAEMEKISERIMGRALYAHRESISAGYISMSGGIRVGMCGSCSYENGRILGISDISSLHFRIPTGECDFEAELREAYRSGIGSGMLIYSPPGVGKTTALRALAGIIGSGKGSLRVAVVDERAEFPEEDLSDCSIDILRGYKRREGIEIATRTLSAELIMIDEIGADDAESIIDVVRCGVPIIATAHAASFDEVKSKRSLRELFETGAFESFLGISKKENKYILRMDRL